MRRVRNVWRRRRQKVAPENRTHPVRHHDAWTRSRDRFRRRPKTPAPKCGWILTELAKLADVPATTVRYCLVQRLLRPIEFRGTVTRYARRDLLTLLGIARLKTEGKSTLEDKKKCLEANTATAASASPALGRTTVEFWQRIALLPGLDLMVRADADDVARSAVQRIYDVLTKPNAPACKTLFR